MHITGLLIFIFVLSLAVIALWAHNTGVKEVKKYSSHDAVVDADADADAAEAAAAAAAADAAAAAAAA